MRSKRKKTRLDPAKVLWLLLVINVAAGLYASPITSLTRLRVTGAWEEDRDWLRKTVQSLKDKPFLQADREGVERRLLLATHVDRIDLRANLFGSGRLEVTYHEPVAVVDPEAGLYLSDRGVLFVSPYDEEGLPRVRLPEGALSLSFVHPWPVERLAWLSQNLPKPFEPNGTVLEVESNGALCLNTGAAGRIRLGDAENLAEKLRVVTRLLDEQPDLLSKVDELNVTSPQRPVRTPRKAGVR